MRNLLFFGAFFLAIILVAVILALVGRWVYKDAKTKGLQAGMWAAIAVLTPNFIGLLIYIVYRADKKPMMTCMSCGNRVDLNVSFCPYCGYQAPPLSEAPSALRIPKKIILLVCVPVLIVMMGAGLVAGLGVLSYSGARNTVVSREYVVNIPEAPEVPNVPSVAEVVESNIPEVTEVPDVPSVAEVVESKDIYDYDYETLYGQDYYYELNEKNGFYELKCAEFTERHEIDYLVHEFTKGIHCYATYYGSTVNIEITDKDGNILEPVKQEKTKEYGYKKICMDFDVSNYQNETLTIIIEADEGDEIKNLHFAIPTIQG